MDRWSLSPIAAGEHAECERILRSVPEWFGIEESLLAYVDATRSMPTWMARMADKGPSTPPIGFITIRRHFPLAAEIHCMAVERALHGSGAGRAMVRHVERWCREQGVRFLQVKTMGPSMPNAEYAATRLFYLAVGFVEVEEFIGLWGKMPALQLIKTL